MGLVTATCVVLCVVCTLPSIYLVCGTAIPTSLYIFWKIFFILYIHVYTCTYMYMYVHEVYIVYLHITHQLY